MSNIKFKIFNSKLEIKIGSGLAWPILISKGKGNIKGKPRGPREAGGDP